MNSRGKRSAIYFRRYLTALITHCMEFRDHHHLIYTLTNFSFLRLGYRSYCFSTSFATTSPLIKQGGTPGPGTVNCPVKNKFFTFLLWQDGLKIAVCINVFAKPYALPRKELYSLTKSETEKDFL